MAKSTAKKSVKQAAKKKPAPAKKPTPKLVKKATPVKKSAPAKKTAAQKPAAKPAKKPEPKAAAKAVVKPTIKMAPAPAPKPKKPKSEYKPAKLPAGYKPTDKEDYMNAQQQEYFRQKLLNWRKELIAESRETLDHLHEENWHQADIADRASLETEAGVELRTRNRYLKLISKIDAAIRRIEDGEYGYCEDTGDEIGLKRLEARPVVTRTTEAQERYERAEKQYSDDD